MRKSMLVAAVAVAGVGAFAAVGFGDEGSTRPSALDREFERVDVHRTHAPGASASATAVASKKGKPKVKYLETTELAVPAGGLDVSTQCPKKHKALSGYFISSGGIVLDVSAISSSSTRMWEFGLFSPSSAAGSAIIGVVCGKRL